MAARPDAAKLLADDPELVAARRRRHRGEPAALPRRGDRSRGVVGARRARRRPPVARRQRATSWCRWKDLEELRIAARDLLGLDPLEDTVAAISALAADVLAAAHRLVAPEGPPLAVIGMGKLGGNELNYASDIDVMFVGDGDPVELAKTRPPPDRRGAHVLPRRRQPPSRRQGRPARALARLVRGVLGPMGRAVGVPGPAEGPLPSPATPSSAPSSTRPPAVASGRGSSPPTTCGRVRHLKARSESELARRGLTDREVKRGRGGIRDIEFAVQLLQLVHGRLDPDLRSPTTLTALAELGAGRVRRRGRRPPARRRLPLPAVARAPAPAARRHPGVRDARRRRASAGGSPGRSASATPPSASALEQLDAALARHQATVRTIHERLYFRPLLEAFAAGDEELLRRPGAVEARLSAFGFSDGLRTRAAVRELTRGLTRSSRLMQQILPLLLGWLVGEPGSRPRAAQRAQPGQRPAPVGRAHPDVPRVAGGGAPALPPRRHHTPGGRHAAAEPGSGRPASRSRPAGHPRTGRAGRVGDARPRLAGGARGAPAGPAALEGSPPARRDRPRRAPRQPRRRRRRGRDRDRRGQPGGRPRRVRVDAAVRRDRPRALRRGGALVRQRPRRRLRLRRVGRDRLRGGDPAGDGPAPLRRRADARPSGSGTSTSTCGRRASRARSPDRSTAYATYFHRWAHVWERQAMLRARPVAGDPDVAQRFMALLEEFVWEPGLSVDDVREIRRIEGAHRAGADPARRGPGVPPQARPGVAVRRGVDGAARCSCARGSASPSTMGALDALVEQRRARARRRRRPRHRLPVLRGHPQPAVPRRQRPGDALPPQESRCCAGSPARSRRRRRSCGRTTGGSPAGPAG